MVQPFGSGFVAKNVSVLSLQLFSVGGKDGAEDIDGDGVEPGVGDGEETTGEDVGSDVDGALHADGPPTIPPSQTLNEHS